MWFCLGSLAVGVLGAAVNPVVVLKSVLGLADVFVE